MAGGEACFVTSSMGTGSTKLEAGEDETTWAIRRRLRLNAAATALGKNLEFRRTENVVYFWSSEGRRRGRPRKNPVA